MYCRKCLKESHGEKKISMRDEIKEKCYICPECGHIVQWNHDEKDKIRFSV